MQVLPITSQVQVRGWRVAWRVARARAVYIFFVNRKELQIDRSLPQSYVILISAHISEAAVPRITGADRGPLAAGREARLFSLRVMCDEFTAPCEFAFGVLSLSLSLLSLSF